MNLYQSLVIQILMEINYKCMNQLKVLSVNGNIVSSDAIIQPGSSGSPILNSKHEAIGVIYAGNKPSGESTRGFAVYFSPEIKKFIADNLDK